jgi:AraC family transcriptional regulator
MMRAVSDEPGSQPAPRRVAVAGHWNVELLSSKAYCVRYCPSEAIIGFAFDAQTGVHSFGTDRRTAFRARPNGLAYVPSGCDVYSESERGGEYLRVVIADRRRDRRSAGRRFSDMVDAEAITAAEALRRLLLGCKPIDPLEAEQHVDVLEQRAQRNSNGVAAKPPAAAWITPQRLRQIEELIDARLDGPLTVSELADALGLSVGFFSRAFKAAVGKTPHSYLIDRRISRARALLRRTNLDLSSIAYASGFASHAHLTDSFRRRLGIAPRELRQSVQR